MNQRVFNFLTKLTPTFMIRSRMRFFAMQATTRFESIGNRNDEVENLISICRFWAEEILKRSAGDEEAIAYKSFPNEPFSNWVNSKKNGKS